MQPDIGWGGTGGHSSQGSLAPLSYPVGGYLLKSHGGAGGKSPIVFHQIGTKFGSGSALSKNEACVSGAGGGCCFWKCTQRPVSEGEVSARSRIGYLRVRFVAGF